MVLAWQHNECLDVFMKEALRDLTHGKVGRQLTQLTIPHFLGIASMIVASMVDAIYIGVLGAKELAAYSFTYPLVMGLFSIAMGLGNGASSIIARAQGAGNSGKVRVFATHALLLTILLVLLLTLATRHWQTDIFIGMGAGEDILPLVESYFGLWVLGLLLYTLPMTASSILRSVGNARIPGIIMTSTSVFQMVLAPVLIFGLLGFPEIGFLGSAWAAILSGLVRCSCMMWIYMVSERLMIFGRNPLPGIRQSTREILQIGFPSMVSSMIGPFTMGVIIWILSEHGSEVVAGFGIVSRIEMLVTMVLMSLSASVGPFVGQNWGAQKINRIQESLKIAYKFCCLWGLVCFLFLGPLGETWVSLINDEPVMVESAGWYLWIVPFTYSFVGIGSIAVSVFIALGSPIPGLILSIIRMALVYIPLSLIMNAWWGYNGVFAATALANIIVGVIAWYWCRSMLKKKSKHIHSPSKNC